MAAFTRWLRVLTPVLTPALLAAAMLSSVKTAARADSTVVFNSNDLQQTIDGFGASSAWIGSMIGVFPPDQQTFLFDALFSPTNGAGLSILRQRIPVEIEPSPGQWDFSHDWDKFWVALQATQRGVQQVWSTPWSPPAWMKTNHDVNHGGELAREHYQDYADYLATYIEQQQSLFGDKFTAISLQNEPDQNTFYESCLWNGTQFHDFIKGYLIPTFQRRHIVISVILPENSWWSDWQANETLNDPYTAQFIGKIGVHGYGGTIAPLSDAQAHGKRVWETEVSNLSGNDSSISDGLYWAMNIHQCLTVANASAWHYWWMCTNDSTGQALININLDNTTYIINKRLWTIGNFSRFVRPGFQRITLSSSNPEPDIFTSAYRDTHSGKIVFVVINNSNHSSRVTAKLPVFSVLSVMPYRTSATENLAPLHTISVANGQFRATTPAYSVTTFVGQGTVHDLTGSIRVHAGGSAVGTFTDDTDYSSGSTYATGNTITTTGVTNPAPKSVYQTQRWGRFTYNFPSLSPHTAYTVRLHFAETRWTTPGQRRFNVAINRRQVLTNLDVVQEAGGANRALAKTFSVNTDNATSIAIQFTNGSADNAMVSGIEILPAPP